MKKYKKTKLLDDIEWWAIRAVIFLSTMVFLYRFFIFIIDF